VAKWYVAIDGRNHISRTNLAGCTTECGITMEIGQALTVSTPALVCQRCEEQYKPAAMGGPMSLPHYLEKQNEALKGLIEETATSLELHDLKKSAKLLRKKLKEVVSASAS
jgi:hypothetical protein